MNYLKSTFLRKLICYLRYLYFVFILRKYNFLMKKEENLSPGADETIKPTYFKDDNFTDKRPKNYLRNMINYESRLFFSNPFNKDIMNHFTGNRSSLLLNPILSCGFFHKKNCKILSIGPRNEGEIYNIIANGFNKKNIEAIDLQTYSPLIKVGDVHEMNFPDNTFDIILCGWVLAYSYNRKKAIEEIIRVAKNKSFVSIGGTDSSNSNVSINQITNLGWRPTEKNSEDSNVLNSDIKKYVGPKLEKVYFELNSQDYPNNFKSHKHNIICFSIKK